MVSSEMHRSLDVSTDSLSGCQRKHVRQWRFRQYFRSTFRWMHLTDRHDDVRPYVVPSGHVNV